MTNCSISSCREYKTHGILAKKSKHIKIVKKTKTAKVGSDPLSTWFSVILGVEYCNLSLVQIVQFVQYSCSKFVFQEELSPTGYHHYQMLLCFTQRMRVSTAIKFLGNAIGGNPQVRASSRTFAPYHSKPQTWVAGPWSKGISGVRTEPLDLVPVRDLTTWQRVILEMCTTKCLTKRAIYWLWSEAGGTGKTALCKRLEDQCDAMLFERKASDIASRVLLEGVKQCYVCHLSRDTQVTGEYKMIENLKDGLLSSGKFKGGQANFNSPHVLIFANYPPDEFRLSADRWQVWELPAATFDATDDPDTIVTMNTPLTWTLESEHGPQQVVAPADLPEESLTSPAPSPNGEEVA